MQTDTNPEDDCAFELEDTPPSHSSSSPKTKRRRRKRVHRPERLEYKDKLKIPRPELETLDIKMNSLASEDKQAERGPLTPAQISNELALIKLEIERAKLRKLQAELPTPEAGYISYEELPPLRPADRERFVARLRDLLASVLEGNGDITEENQN